MNRYFVVMAAAVLVGVLVVKAAEAQEPGPRISVLNAGSVIGTDDIPFLGNTNIRAYTPTPGVDVVVTVGGELFNSQGVENSVGLDGGPGVSTCGLTAAYVYRQKSGDWQGVLLANQHAFECLVREDEPTASPPVEATGALSRWHLHSEGM